MTPLEMMFADEDPDRALVLTALSHAAPRQPTSWPTWTVLVVIAVLLALVCTAAVVL